MNSEPDNTISRKLTIADLIEPNKKNYSQNTNKYGIPKNQQEFGEKKRIKP